MKRILSIIFIIFICGCSNYKMVKLPEPVRDDITKYINAYLIRPTATSSEEFKKVWEIDESIDVDMESFRILIIDWSSDAFKNKSFPRGFIIPIYSCENIYWQENQKIPYNPWEETLKKNSKYYLRSFHTHVTKENGVLYNMTEGYEMDKLDTSHKSGDAFYFVGANEEEIINYIKQIPISVRLGDEDYRHYTLGYCKHTYILNDVNLFIENENGELIKK